jgi:hypothetical protein
MAFMQSGLACGSSSVDPASVIGRLGSETCAARRPASSL